MSALVSSDPHLSALQRRAVNTGSVIDSKLSPYPSSSNKQESRKPMRTISDQKYKQKLKSACKTAGKEAIEKSLLLFYTLRDPNTPNWCRTVIVGALAYFISLVDGIPDLTPVLGYTDDITVMAAALSVLAAHISEDNKLKAKQKADKLFS